MVENNNTKISAKDVDVFYSEKQALNKISMDIKEKEVTALIGAKPGKSKLQRAGLLATKIARNVWKISKISQGNSFHRN